MNIRFSGLALVSSLSLAASSERKPASVPIAVGTSAVYCVPDVNERPWHLMLQKLNKILMGSPELQVPRDGSGELEIVSFKKPFSTSAPTFIPTQTGSNLKALCVTLTQL